MEKQGFYRLPEDKWIAGVCAGIGRWLGFPPLLIRLVFVLMFIPGLPVYLILWLTMPIETPRRSSRAPMKGSR